MTVQNLSRKARITAATIRSLRPGTSPYVIRDAMQRGFQIKVLPTGNAVYQVEARFGGTGSVKKFKIGGLDIALPEARERGRKALDQIRSGTDPLQEKQRQLHEGMTISQLIESYYARKDYKPKTKEFYEGIANGIFKNWLGKRVKDLTKHEIRDWYARGNKTKTRTEGAFRFLHSLMNFAIGLEIVSQNPCEIVTKAGMRYSIKPRTGHIEPNHQLGPFLKAFIDYSYLRDSERVARDIMALILTTGLRKDEARTLQWEQVDFTHKVFTIYDTKNRSDHVVPMTPLTYAMFRYRQAHSEQSKYVFRIKGEGTKSGYITDFRKTLRNICTRAGIPVVSVHDFRRTFATSLGSIDVGYLDAKRLMNHRAKDITGMYMQPDIEKLRGLLIRLVDFYDHKIPVFLGQPCSPYTGNALRFSLYGRGELAPEVSNNPQDDDPAWIAEDERAFWEG